MNIPKKVNDNIIDSIIEIKFTSKVPFEISLGMIYEALDDSYTYTNRPLVGDGAFPLPKDENGNLLFSLGSSNYLFYNDSIKLYINKNALVFNCLKEYIGWEKYYLEIEKVLQQIAKTKVITNYTRVGVRYVNEYKNINLTGISKLEFTFGLPEVKSEAYVLQTEFYFNECRVILNLANQVIKMPVINPKDSDKRVSSVDIDVIQDNLLLETEEEILSIIAKGHQYEKEIFFSILNENFLQSLNPQY